MERLSPRRQGDLGELSAMEWLVSQGYALYLPLGHSPNVDVIAESDSTLLRVQVKTTTRYTKRRWEVMICTRGGTRAGTGSRSCSTPHAATRCSSWSATGGVGSFPLRRLTRDLAYAWAAQSTPSSRSSRGAHSL